MLIHFIVADAILLICASIAWIMEIIENKKETRKRQMHVRHYRIIDESNPSFEIFGRGKHYAG